MLFQPSCSESVIRLDTGYLERKFTDNEIKEIYDYIHSDYEYVKEEPTKGYSHLNNDERHKCFYWYQTSPSKELLTYLNDRKILWDGEFPFDYDEKYDKIADEHEAEEVKDI